MATAVEMKHAGITIQFNPANGKFSAQDAKGTKFESTSLAGIKKQIDGRKQQEFKPFTAIREADVFHTKAADTIEALERRAIAAEQEVARLNKWADGFTDSHLKERATGEAYQRELRDKLSAAESALAEARERIAVLERALRDKHRAEIEAAHERIKKCQLPKD